MQGLNDLFKIIKTNFIYNLITVYSIQMNIWSNQILASPNNILCLNECMLWVLHKEYESAHEKLMPHQYLDIMVSKKFRNYL